MMRVTEFAHLLMRQSLKAGDWAVDATTGNGHDTLFLAELVGSGGRVFGFDIQHAALAAAAERVDGLPQVTLIYAGHETLAERISANGPVNDRDRLAAVMFNLADISRARPRIS